jgi:hypothetical protein
MRFGGRKRGNMDSNIFTDQAMSSATIENDLVATWNVPMSDKVYKIEFEHGTTTGKRILRINGKVSRLPM